MRLLVSFRIWFITSCECAPKEKVKGFATETREISIKTSFPLSCNQISVTVLLCHLKSISADPGIVEVSPEFKRTREKSSISTKLPSYNLITDIVKTTTPSTASSLQSFKITAEDVVTGSNSVYGSSANIQNGGVIFAISQGQGSTSQPLMSAGESWRWNLKWSIWRWSLSDQQEMEK